MIESTLILLRNKLQEHLDKIDSSATVIIDNIGTCNSPEGENLRDKIVITLINIEEESALQHLLPAHDRIDHVLPFHYNLYVLVTCNYPGNYQMALRRLDMMFHFFRNIPQFLFNEQKEYNLQFIAQLLPLNIQEVCNLWNSPGISHLPFVLYKLKVTENNEEIMKG